MTRKHIVWGVLVACLIGILLARTALTLEKAGVPVTPINPIEPVRAIASPASNETTRPSSKSPPASTQATAPQPPVAITLEGLAQWALDHEGEMVDCFEGAYREGRLGKRRAQVHMAAGPSREGHTTLYLSVPDSDEHLHEVEACLNQIADRTILEPAADGDETGVMWSVSLPVEQWD